MTTKLSRALLIGIALTTVPPSPAVTARVITEAKVTGRKPGAKAVSWYSTEACKYNPNPLCPTADGSSLYDLEKKHKLFGASFRYPLGSTVRVTYQGRSINITIRDRGPNKRLGRELDISRDAFKQLSPLSTGIIYPKIERIS